MAGGGSGSGEASAAGGGKVACAAWIRRREEKAAAAVARVFAAYGRAGAAGSPPALEVLGFDAKECSLSPEPLVRKRGPSGSTSSSSPSVCLPGSVSAEFDLGIGFALAGEGRARGGRRGRRAAQHRGAPRRRRACLRHRHGLQVRHSARPWKLPACSCWCLW